jgi:aspartyl-tRNA(Asn)/glutamyl-tRNA(Gln) amidotransferase subunit A
MGLGSDTRGSIRHPAALCGITGWKPTQRRVPREGAFPLSYTLGETRRALHASEIDDTHATLRQSTHDAVPAEDLASGGFYVDRGAHGV